MNVKNYFDVYIGYLLSESPPEEIFQSKMIPPVNQAEYLWHVCGQRHTSCHFHCYCKASEPLANELRLPTEVVLCLFCYETGLGGGPGYPTTGFHLPNES